MTVPVADIDSAASGATGTRMPKSAPRETWADWLGDALDPDALLRRDELLARLAAEGITVRASDLANWQKLNVIPLGIPRRRGRSPIRLYPETAVVALAFVRQLQADRRSMADIRTILRNTFHTAVRNRDAVPLVLAGGRVTSRLDVPVLTASADALTPTVIARPHPPTALHTQIIAFARQIEQTSGRRLVRAELRFVDDHDQPLTYDLATARDSPG
jgi:hypothetical protein